MSNVAIAVASNFLSKEAKELEIPVGVHELDGLEVRMILRGKAKKSQDEDYVPTISVPFKAVLALVFQRMGIQQPLMRQMFVDAMTEALRDGEKAEEYVSAFTKNYETWEAEVTSTLASLPKATRKGKLTVNGADYELEIVNPEATDAQMVTGLGTVAAITNGR